MSIGELPVGSASAASNDSDAVRHGGHALWVRSCHWILAASVLTLAFSGFVVLMAHPRLYWGIAGNDLTPALLELPISRNFHHGGWINHFGFFAQPNSPVSAERTYDIFNDNGWGRSLHFLAAWIFTVTGALYLVMGLLTRHLTRDLTPGLRELAPSHVWDDIKAHARLQIQSTTGGPPYGALQKLSYALVLLVMLPLMILTGITMSPAITAAYPFLLDLFGGSQSARTIHFFTFTVILLFFLVHVLMVVLSGFRRQIRAMTVGD